MDLLTPTANSSQEEVATNLEELDGFKQYLRRVRKSGSNRALFSHQSDLRYRSLSPPLVSFSIHRPFGGIRIVAFFIEC